MPALVQSVLVARNSLFGVEQSRKRTARTMRRMPNDEASPQVGTSKTPADTPPRLRRARVHSTVRSVISKWYFRNLSKQAGPLQFFGFAGQHVEPWRSLVKKLD